MSEYGRLWKHENNQHAPYPRRWNVAAQVAEELKTVTYATPLLWRNAEEEEEYSAILYKKWTHCTLHTFSWPQLTG